MKKLFVFGLFLALVLSIGALGACSSDDDDDDDNSSDDCREIVDAIYNDCNSSVPGSSRDEALEECKELSSGDFDCAKDCFDKHDDCDSYLSCLENCM